MGVVVPIPFYDERRRPRRGAPAEDQEPFVHNAQVICPAMPRRALMRGDLLFFPFLKQIR